MKFVIGSKVKLKDGIDLTDWAPSAKAFLTKHKYYYVVGSGQFHLDCIRLKGSIFDYNIKYFCIYKSKKLKVKLP